MYSNFFYHGTVRNTIIAFGSLFSNIRIQRDVDGERVQDIRVPILYAQKEKYVIRRQEDKALEAVMSIDLPRMSFEITTYSYDSPRKINSTHKLIRQVGEVRQQFAPVPYNIGLKLHMYTKTQEDALIMLEQILPMFTPEYNVTITTVADMEIRQDVPIQLNSTAIETVYTEGREEVRMIIHTLDFVAKINLFGPVAPSGIIKFADVSIDNFNNTNIEKYQAEVVPRSANRDDDHQIVETAT